MRDFINLNIEINMDGNANQENLDENVQNLEPEIPAKKRRKTKGKKHQVSIKNKNRNQRDYRKEPAPPVRAPEPPLEAELVVEDQVAFELEPLPDLPDKSKKLRLFPQIYPRERMIVDTYL